MRPLDTRTPRHTRSGFTLVEIMAATGIMLVVILLVLSLTTNVLSSWTRSTGQLQTNFEARVAMDLLTSDLESMVVRNRNICWVQVEYNDQAVGAIKAGNSPILYFFAPALERPRDKGTGKDNILGDVCAISYRLDYQNPFTRDSDYDRENPPAPIYALYRSVVDSENTFNNVLAIANYDPSDESNTTLAGYWNGNGIDSTGTGLAHETYDESGATVTINEDWILNASNFLSQNVAKFEAIFWYLDSSGDYQPITEGNDPTKPGYPFIYAGGGLYINGSTTPESGAKLAYVDISLTIVDKEGATLLNEDDTATAYNEVVSQHGEVFTRRINLMSSPL